MKFLVPWFVFGVLLFQPRSSQAQHVFDMGLKGSSGTIPFRLDNGFLILVEGRIGTQSNLRFLLDTGATISILDKKMAEKLKLVEFRPPESFNFGRKIAWSISNVPGVQFGPIKASSVKDVVRSFGCVLRLCTECGRRHRDGFAEAMQLQYRL